MITDREEILSIFKGVIAAEGETQMSLERLAFALEVILEAPSLESNSVDGYLRRLEKRVARVELAMHQTTVADD